MTSAIRHHDVKFGTAARRLVVVLAALAAIALVILAGAVLYVRYLVLD